MNNMLQQHTPQLGTVCARRAHVASYSTPCRPVCSVRVPLAPKHHLSSSLRAAAHHDQATTSESACPFANVVSDSSNGIKSSAAVAAAATGLRGTGWQVLPQGNVQGLPEAEGDWCWNPLLGEFGQLEQQGAGAFLLQRFKKYGPVFSFMLGNEKMVAVIDYDTIKSLLQNADGKAMTGWMPAALIAMLGEGARRNLEVPSNRVISRKLMAPGFTRDALRGYLGKIEAICEKQLDAWAAQDSAVDLRAEGKALSFEFSTQLLVDFDVPEDQKADIKRKLDDLFQGMFAPPVPLPGTRFSRGLKAKTELRQDILKIIKDSRQQRSAEKADSSVFQYNLEARRQIMGTEGDLPDESVAESGIGLIIAGNDTSGLGISALLAILPLFPEVMQKLRQEQQEVVARFGPELSVNVLDAMPYADAVVKEVLRVAPPSSQVTRQTLCDMEILGKFVPAGSKLFLSSLMGQVLTDPKVHPHLQPDELTHLGENWYTIDAASLAQDFRPDRWLGQPGSSQPGPQEPQPGHQASAKPSGLLTFSVGPHICLGLTLFMHEAKVLLAKLARGYSLEAENPSGLGFDVVMVSQLRSGARVRISKLPAGAAVEAPVPGAR